MNQLRALLTESALSGEFNVNYTAGQLLNVFDVQFQGDVERPKFSCPAGSVPIKASNDNNNNNNNNSTTSNHDFARCVYCPIGTFFNVVNEVCESCSQGSYQPEEGQLSCLVCPHNTSTKVVNAKRSDDCQGILYSRFFDKSKCLIQLFELQLNWRVFSLRVFICGFRANFYFCV